MSLLALAGTNSATGGYDIDNSLKFEADNNESLQKTLSSDGNKQTWTVSCWVKRTELANQMIFAAQDTYLYFVDNKIRINTRNDLTDYFFETAALFRDTSAWYHCVVAVDTTNSTASERTRVYVNGVEYSSTNTTYQNNTSGTRWNDSTKTQRIGRYDVEGLNFSGYLAEFHSIDGQQLAPTEFGEYDDDSGIWKPKAYTGSYGSKGFYLDFSDAANLGDDASGNGNNFTENNITAADQATDTPTNNFATGNAITYFSSSTTVSEGATKIAKGANGWETLSSTIAVTSGKWYAEVRNDTVSESALASIFPTDANFLFQGGQITTHAGSASGDGGVSYYSYNGNKYVEGTNSAYGNTWTGSTNTIGIALDMDNGYVYFAKDNTWQNSGDPTSGGTGTGGIAIPDYTTKPYMIGYAIYANATDGFINLGGFTGASIASAASDSSGYGTFEYAPPSGYYALCTKNLAEYG